MKCAPDTLRNRRPGCFICKVEVTWTPKTISASSSKCWYPRTRLHYFLSQEVTVFIHSAVCFMTDPQHISKSLFSKCDLLLPLQFQYSVFPLGHPIVAYVFLLFFPSLISFNTMFYNAVPTQDVTNPVILPSVYSVWNISFLLDSILYYFISHMISPTDILHPSPARPLQTSRCFWSTFRYRPFATRVSQLKIWHFWVTGIERNLCRCTFNRYSVITQFAKLAAGEQLCRRCTCRKL